MCESAAKGNAYGEYFGEEGEKEGEEGENLGEEGEKDGLEGEKEGLEGEKEGLEGEKEGLEGLKEGLAGEKLICERSWSVHCAGRHEKERRTIGDVGEYIGLDRKSVV